MREIDELAEVDDPAWPELEGMLAASAVPVRVLPADRDEGRRCLLQMQVTARSTLGALALNTGGLLLDDGWLRVFGGGSARPGGGSIAEDVGSAAPGAGSGAEDRGPGTEDRGPGTEDRGPGADVRGPGTEDRGLSAEDRGSGTEGGADARGGGLPSLGRVNGFPAVFDPAWHPAAGLVVGHDVVGGVFALNGHDPVAVGRPGAPGQMTYFAPDTLEWEALGMGHSGWVSWLLSGRLERFYEGLRWPGWRAEAAALVLSEGITVYPFPWSEEAGADLAATRRKAVPMREVLGVAAEFADRLGTRGAGFLGEV